MALNKYFAAFCGFVCFISVSQTALANYDICADPDYESFCENWSGKWWHDYVYSVNSTPLYEDPFPGGSVSYLGLEWLNWNETLNMSINQALDTYSADGWRLASNLEVSTLFNDLFSSTQYTSVEIYDPSVRDWFNTGSNEFDSSENVIQTSWSGSGDHDSAFLYKNFGLTDKWCDPMDGCNFYISALYGDDANNNGLYKSAYYSYTVFDTHSYTTVTLGLDEYDANFVPKSQKESDFLWRTESPEFNGFDHASGIALVRAPRPSTPFYTHAPEINGQGAALALALLSSLMLFFRERFRLHRVCEQTA